MKRPLVTACRTKLPAGMLALLLAAFLAWSGTAFACNVPVFRYALERWQPDPYRATLFHRGPLSEAQHALLRPLEGASGKGFANVVLRLVDVDKFDDDADRTLFDAHVRADPRPARSCRVCRGH